MYIKKCSSPILSDQTLYEQLFGTPPNYNPLKVFGYVHFGLLQPHELTKLQPTHNYVVFLVINLNKRSVDMIQ